MDGLWSRLKMWWRDWSDKRFCGRWYHHCWHPIGMVDWKCCLCPGFIDGMPPDECIVCVWGEHPVGHEHR